MLKRNTSPYKSLHARIARSRGQASFFKCVDCSAQASEWSFMYGEEQMDEFSYEPRCRSCHAKYDEIKVHCDTTGSKNGRAKITEDIALEIRTKYREGGHTHRSLSREYGVVRSHVARILSGTAWREGAKNSKESVR